MAAAALVLLCSAVCLGACAHADGVDASAATAAKVDPEVEPLPPSPKRRMRDPRGVPVFDAEGANAAPETTADASVAAAPVVAAPVVAAPVVPAPVVPACGTTADPCPMQRFMHGAMETAHTPDTLTAAFTRVAGMSPDPAWSWVAIATRGADLANAGDLAGAKAQCKACHDAYREPYRQLHRTRRL
jgi:hypothetical protein